MSQLNDIMTQLTDGVTALPAVKKVYNYLSDLSDGQPYPTGKKLIVQHL